MKKLTNNLLKPEFVKKCEFEQRIDLQDFRQLQSVTSFLEWVKSELVRQLAIKLLDFTEFEELEKDGYHIVKARLYLFDAIEAEKLRQQLYENNRKDNA